MMMPLHRAFIALALLILGARPALAVGPSLSLEATCESLQVGTGTSLAVPIVLHANVGDDGQPNQVAGLDLAVAFPPDALTVTDVRLPASLAEAGWTLGWEGSLNVPQMPGRVTIALLPAFEFPVPTLPDGPIAEIAFTSVAAGQRRCAALELVADSVVASRPPLGDALPLGTLTSGGVAITELCDSCADDDEDGLVDLADPDCGASAIEFPGRKDKVTVVRKKKSGEVIVKVRGLLDGTVGPGPIAAQFVLRAGDAATCATLDATEQKRTSKKKQTIVLTAGGRKVATLKSDPRKGRTTLLAALTGLEVGTDVSLLELSIRLGAVGHHATLQRVGSEPIYR